MNKEKSSEILFILQKKNKNNTTTLIYNSPFELLIAVLLSAQSKDIQVNKITKHLFQVANTPIKMLYLGKEKIIFSIKSIGLFKKKSEYIINICKILIKKYQGIIPKKRSALEQLPGVGRKTANIILNIIFGKKTIAVDTHVFRVCNRTGLAIGNNVIKVEKKLLEIVPENIKINCHNILLHHGRYICTSNNPHCNICIIKHLCEF